jgi:hypothetical protein
MDIREHARVQQIHFVAKMVQIFRVQFVEEGQVRFKEVQFDTHQTDIVVDGRHEIVNVESNVLFAHMSRQFQFAAVYVFLYSMQDRQYIAVRFFYDGESVHAVRFQIAIGRQTSSRFNHSLQSFVGDLFARVLHHQFIEFVVLAVHAVIDQQELTSEIVEFHFHQFALEMERVETKDELAVFVDGHGFLIHAFENLQVMFENHRNGFDFIASVFDDFEIGV